MPQSDNLFNKITFDTTGINTNGGFLPDFSTFKDAKDIKQVLLKQVSKVINTKEKESLKNHTVGKIRAEIKIISAGSKMRKVVKTKIHPSAKKNDLRNAAKNGIYVLDQCVSLLKRISDYIKKDKTENFDFEKFNDFVKKNYQHYQDKVSLQIMTNELEGRIKRNLKHGEDKNPLNSVSDASERLDKHKKEMGKHKKEFSTPKSNFAKIVSFATEPLMPSVKQAKEAINKTHDDKTSDKKIAVTTPQNIVSSMKEYTTTIGSEHIKPGSSINASKSKNNGIERI